MIAHQECINEILENFPDIQSDWNSHLDYWEGEKPPISIDFSLFSDYAVKEFQNKNLERVKDLLLFIEKYLVRGTEEVKDAVATCFLESLQNAVDEKRIPGKALFNLLGPESVAYCRAWDKFNGCQTEGFWDEE